MPDKYGNWQPQDLFAGGIPQLLPKWDSSQNMLTQQAMAGLGIPTGLAGGIVGTAVGNPLISGALDAATLPGDVYQGKVDLNSPAGFGRAQNMAGMLMGGGMPMAEAGAAGIFGGKLAKTANLDARKQAEGLAAKGADREAIWNETGWFQGKDGEWRFEIPDYGVNVGSKFANRLSGGPGGTEGSASGRAAYALPHPELYAAYPELRNINVLSQYDAAGRPYKGSFTPAMTGSDPMIRADANSLYGPNGVQGVMLHELQHAVQAMEGFNPGANPRSIKAVQGMSPENADAWRYFQYLRNAGEVEARNVQARMKMKPDELKDVPPWYTEAIPYDQQWLRLPGQ